MSEIEVQANSAVYYEKRYSGWGLRYHKTVIDWMMEGIWADAHVLDAGCGTGIISRMYPVHHTHGVDISEEMIRRCPTANHMVGDVTEINVYSGSFDAVVCRSLLHHLPDHKLALKEFHRVLKPGGKLVLWETNKGWLAQKVRAKTQHGDRFSEYHHAFKSGELEHDLREAGFRIEEVRHMGFIGYPLFGFPDIVDIQKYVPFKDIFFPIMMALDYLLESIPLLNRMSWAVGIKATKL